MADHFQAKSFSRAIMCRSYRPFNDRELVEVTLPAGATPESPSVWACRFAMRINYARRDWV